MPLELVPDPRQRSLPGNVLAPAEVLYDAEAERAVLAAVLLGGEQHENVAFTQVAAILRDAEDFYHPPNAIVWRAIVAIGDRNEPVDVVTLVHELRRMDRINTIGGAQYIGELTDVIPTTAHVETHARIVADLATQRRHRDTLWSLAHWASRPGRTPEQIAERALTDAVAMASGREVASHTAGSSFDEVCADIASEEAPLRGVCVPWNSLARHIPSVEPGQLIVVAARPSVGKTAYALALAYAAAKAGGCLFVSLETQHTSLIRRLAASLGGIRLDALRKRVAMNDAEFAAIGNVAMEMEKLPLVILDNPDQTVASIRAQAQRLKAQGRLRAVVVDYLQLMQGERRDGGNREQEIAEMSRGFKKMGLALDVPVIVLSQLNRESEKQKRRPNMTDLRESGAIEQDADVIMFLHRDAKDGDVPPEVQDIDVIVEKQRDGARGVFARLAFRGAIMRFSDPDEPQFDDGAALPSEATYVAPHHTTTHHNFYDSGADDGDDADGVPFGVCNFGTTVIARGGDAE